MGELYQRGAIDGRTLGGVLFISLSLWYADAIWNGPTVVCGVRLIVISFIKGFYPMLMVFSFVSFT